MLAASGCGLSGRGLPLGYTGDYIPSCAPTRADGAIRLEPDGRIHAMRTGTGSITCRDGHRIPFDVRRPAVIEIVLYGQPQASVAQYVYTHVLDADGHLLHADDRFEWSAVNGDIEPGTCRPLYARGCVTGNSAATLLARPPTTTIRVTYAGVTASRTVPVLPADE